MTQNWLNTEVTQINSSFLLIAVDMDTGQFRLSIFFFNKDQPGVFTDLTCKFSLIVSEAYPSLTACLEFQEQSNSHSDIREAKHFTSRFSATNHIWQFYSFSHTTSETSNPKWLGLLLWLFILTRTDNSMNHENTCKLQDFTMQR